MKALILAAGYATRLYPLTKDFPKPLLTVGRRPIIDYIIDNLSKVKDIDEIIVVTNSKFISKFKKWVLTQHCQKRISLLDDLSKDHSDRRGAIGDMNFVIDKKRIRDDLLVIGGDNLFDGYLDGFISFAKANEPNPVIGIYDIKDKMQAKKYGVIKLDAKFKVIDFKEKPNKPKSTIVAMCLYYFPKEKLGLIKEYLSTKANKPRPSRAERGKHDATGFYIDWLRKKEPVYGFAFDGRWYDIGHRQFYNEAKEEFVR